MQTVKFHNEAITPSKILYVGRNYAAHIEELGNEVPDDMVVFNKPNSAISGTLHSTLGEALHYEGELAFLVHNGELTAVGFGLDLTKRELQSKLKTKGLPWERAKAFDGAAVFSDFVSLPADINTLALRLSINAQVRQQGGVSLMMYKPQMILQQLSRYTSVEDGDIIMTGTPQGVGVVRSGDNFEAQVLASNKVLVSANWVAQ